MNTEYDWSDVEETTRAEASFISPGSQRRKWTELDRPLLTAEQSNELGESSAGRHPLAKEFTPQPITTTRFQLPIPRRNAILELVQEVLRSGSIYHGMQKTRPKPHWTTPQVLPRQKPKTEDVKKVPSGDSTPSKKSRYTMTVVSKTETTGTMNISVPRAMGSYPVHPYAVLVRPASGVGQVSWRQQESVQMDYQWEQVGGVLTETSVEKSEKSVGEESEEKQRVEWTTKTTTTHAFDE